MNINDIHETKWCAIRYGRRVCSNLDARKAVPLSQWPCGNILLFSTKK